MIDDLEARILASIPPFRSLYHAHAAVLKCGVLRSGIPGQWISDGTYLSLQ